MCAPQRYPLHVYMRLRWNIGIGYGARTRSRKQIAVAMGKSQPWLTCGHLVMSSTDGQAHAVRLCMPANGTACSQFCACSQRRSLRVAGPTATVKYILWQPRQPAKQHAMQHCQPDVPPPDVPTCTGAGPSAGAP